jgi:hypothetical protein
MESSRSIGLVWMSVSFGIALCLTASVLGVLGTADRGVDAALAATARLAFLFFWSAYSGSALTELFGSAFQPLKRRGRELGLAFASVLPVHLGLVAWLCLIGDAPSFKVFVVFGLAAAWAFLLVYFSFGRRHRSVGPKTAWVLRNVGMNYIAYAFAVDFLRNPLRPEFKHLVEYLPFAVLALVGPSLRVVAWAKRVARASP